MKNKTTEYKLFAGAFILLIVQLLILASCSTPDHPYYNYELVHIQDEDTFLYATSKQLSNGWINIANGNYYTYTISCCTVSVLSDKQPKEVIYYYDMLDKHGKQLVIDGNKVEYEKKNEYELLEFRY